jgi:hypothetical protein
MSIAPYLIGAALWGLMVGYFAWAEIADRRARRRATGRPIARLTRPRPRTASGRRSRRPARLA